MPPGLAPSSPPEAWGNFHVILGSSAGALTGQQFVVMTLVAQTSDIGPRYAGSPSRRSGSPNVVHFCAALLVAAIQGCGMGHHTSLTRFREHSSWSGRRQILPQVGIFEQVDHALGGGTVQVRRLVRGAVAIFGSLPASSLFGGSWEGACSFERQDRNT